MTDFKPMLAKDADLAKLSFPVIVQPKLDGIRCAIVNGKPLSRTLKLIPNLEIQAALSDPRFEGLDGELIVGPVTAADAYRRTSSFVMAPNKTGEPWAFYTFDKWDAAGGYRQRKPLVQYGSLASSRIVDLTFLDYMALTPDDLEAIEEQHIAAGHEGVIVRTLDDPYKFGRSGKTGPLLKVKRFVDFEATIVGVYEELHNANEKVTNELGRGQRSSHKANKHGKGTLGGFVLRAINGPWSGVEFRCGTGFNAEQRAKFWLTSSSHAPGDFVKGKTVKVKAFDVGSKDKPRHPVFLGFRDLEVDG